MAHALRAGAGEAGGHLALGAEPHVPRRTSSPGYSREEFIDDLLNEHEPKFAAASSGRAQGADGLHRRPAGSKARSVGKLLNSFIDLNNLALSRFSAEELGGSACTPAPAGIAIPPTAPRSTTRNCCRACSSLKAGNFYIALAGEQDRVRVLKIIREQ